MSPSFRQRCLKLLVVIAALGLGATACEPSSRSTRYPPQQPAPNQPYGPQPGYGQQPGYAGQQPGYAGQQPGYQQQPGYPPPGPGQPPPQQPPPQQPPPQQPPPTQVGYDPINAIDIGFLRQRAQAVLNELVAALQGGYQQRVQGVPLVVDDTVGEVNAFAACTKGGKALMAISDGLLDIEAHLAQAKATDEVFGTRKVDEYIAFLAKYQRPNAPVARPAAGFFDPTRFRDSRKVKRQHEVLDEQIAFVLGHELAHHYLGHLPCTGGGGVSAADVGRVLSSTIPVFNQPNELASDMAGTNNVLTAGSRRQGYRWTEGGGLLTMQFFAGLDQMSPTDILFGFERTHPPPAVRVPVIQQTANTWRSTGGQGLPFPFGF